MEKWCFSDQKTCGTQTRTSPGLTTGLTPTPRSTESSKGTLSLGVRIVIRIAIGIGILIVLFVICLAIILIIGHCPNKKAAAASGPIDEISGLAMPVNTETEQQMHPTLQRVQA
ncbi:hypothetical protein MKX01_030010 [Papaver californicum]|nr:hypothetical protein MKX01_030010 [Papaver californicum]